MQQFSNIAVPRGRNRISPRFDLTGKRFHKLTVLRFYDYYKKARRWECLCDCGKITLAVANDLVHNKRVSCGCERFTAGNNTKYKYNSRTAYANTRTGALKRGYSFSISFEEFVNLLSDDCYYCSGQTNCYYCSGQTSGLDRIDNSGNYTVYNLVACCAKCNRMKNVLNQTEFLALVKRIYEKRIATSNG